VSVPPTPAENFAILLTWLSQSVAAMMGGERLPLKLIALITGRLRRIKQRFAALAARIRDGRYVPRHRQKAAGRPLPPDPLPKKFGWLLPLVPDAVGYRGQFENLLRDPEMAALIAAAPAPMAKTLRPLCRMLGLTPPPILAPPERKPRPKRATQAAAPEKPPRPWPPPEAPEWLRTMPGGKPWSLSRLRRLRSWT
jgi:hypothetical protein